MERLLARLRAVAEPTRLRLLALCGDGELTVTELAQILGQSQPRVSRHLKLLCDAGLLDRFPEGNWVFYRLAQDADEAALGRALIDLIPDGDSTLSLDLQRLERVKEARAEEANAYFRENAPRWNEIRSLHVPESEVERVLLDILSDWDIGDLLDIGTGTGRMLELFGPRVAKATGIPVAKIAARVMTGETLASFNLGKVAPRNGHMAVKEAVFPFARFPGVDIILGPEMKSTGEVMGLDADFERAFAKSQLGAGNGLPTGGAVFISVKDRDKATAAQLARRLSGLGFELLATGGTQEFLSAQGLAVTRVNKVQQGAPHCVDAINDGGVQLVINTTEGAQAITDSYTIRRGALVNNIPHYTTMTGAAAAVMVV